MRVKGPYTVWPFYLAAIGCGLLTVLNFFWPASPYVAWMSPCAMGICIGAVIEWTRANRRAREDVHLRSVLLSMADVRRLAEDGK